MNACQEHDDKDMPKTVANIDTKIDQETL